MDSKFVFLHWIFFGAGEGFEWRWISFSNYFWGMNKMVINHLEKLFVTNDAATILRELEVSYFF